MDKPTPIPRRNLKARIVQRNGKYLITLENTDAGRKRSRRAAQYKGWLDKLLVDDKTRAYLLGHMGGKKALASEPTFTYLMRHLADAALGKSTVSAKIVVQYIGDIVLYYGLMKQGGGWRFLGRPLLTQQPPGSITEEEAAWVYQVIYPDEHHDLIAKVFDSPSRHYTLEYDVRITPNGDDMDLSYDPTVHLFAHGSLQLISVPKLKAGGVTPSMHWEDPQAHELLLVASPHIRNAAAAVCQTWTNPSIGAFLVVAPPGSGKEEIVKFARNGLLLPTSPITFALPEITEKKEIRALLLPAAGKEAFVLVDEVDKVQAEMRSAFLRFLESRTLDTPDDLRHTVFAFSAASPTDVLRRTKGPVDFWTRIQLVAESPHPLMVGSSTERRRILDQYIRLFVWRWLNDPQLEARILQLHGSQIWNSIKVLRRATKVSIIVAAIGEPLDQLCAVRLPSIRTVRTLVDRVCWGILATAAGSAGNWRRTKTEYLAIQPPFKQPARRRKVLELGQRELDAWCQERVPAMFLECST